MSSFFYWLLDSDSFLTRNTCGDWTPQLIAIYQLANFLIALAYFAIPLSLLTLYFKIKALRQLARYNHWIIMMFVAFISLCGITHLMHVVVFWWPAYRFFTLLDLLTGVISLFTAIILPLVLYDLFRRTEDDKQTD